jgi:hypothetical protein
MAISGLPTMRIPCFQIACFSLLCAVLLLGIAPAAHAVSCTVSAGMSASERTALETAASNLGGDVARGDTAALQAGSAQLLASNFGEIAATVGGLAQSLKGATVTVESLYALHAGDLTGTESDVQFFCSRPASPLLVTATLGQLPPGEYALTIVHASGVAAPQQFAFVLQNVLHDTAASHATAQWQLAGFFVRPLTLGGHPELWFWEQARAMKNAPLSAYLYYEAAAYLSRPADLYTSGNLDKLNRETSAVEPKGLPGDTPMLLSGPGGNAFSVTGMRIDTSLGAMDLRVDANVGALGDAVTSRKSALDLMSALLTKYPDLRESFHGLWVFEKATDGQAYAVEQPMSALQ